MMTKGYDDLYVEDAMVGLAEFFYSGVCLIKYDIEELFRDFSFSSLGMNFSVGNPRVVTGMSGSELLRALIYEIKGEYTDIPHISDMTFRYSDEYNVGYALGYYQWKVGKSFKLLYKNGLTMEKARIALNNTDADLERFSDNLTSLIDIKAKGEEKSPSTIARLRSYWEWSQRELSEKTGVSLRMIQLYEQGQNDISKASADVVYRLSKALGCRMEDLL